MLKKSVTEMLNQGLMLLNSINEEQYRRKSQAAYGASLGGHYRHVIDHLSVLLGGLDARVINYDLRQRDVGVETDLYIAQQKTQDLADAWNLISDEELNQTVEVVSKVSYAGCDAASVQSTVGREAMYVVIHGVHHYALIGVMCNMMEIELPVGFGVAPSTVAHEQKQELTAAN